MSLLYKVYIKYCGLSGIAEYLSSEHVFDPDRFLSKNLGARSPFVKGRKTIINNVRS